ncbi:MAG: amidophosphoribosyltransferase [Bradymonadales bacterium]|nr:MAG: amidophosphoribosyltransferase [Bradymonadales bacterium]
MKSSWRENCGVFGIWKVPEAAHLNYLGLFALQHRGQEGAGIVSGTHESFWGRRSSGLVSQVFDREALNQLQGETAIGHVRYSTVGNQADKNLQPLWVQGEWGELAVAHNGTLTNAQELRLELESQGSVFQSSVDTEVILHLFARTKGSFRERIDATLSRVAGAFSLLILYRDSKELRLAAIKDPFGFRPLCVGRLQEGYAIGSESCAFDLVGASWEAELEAGEVYEFHSKGVDRWKLNSKAPRTAPCVFEWIYFSRPDSNSFGRSVYEFRKQTGALLAERDQRASLRADLVMGVPDSGIPAAIGYSQQSGLPFEMGLIRNHYIGRTFIEPHQSIRDFRVKIKQNPLPKSLEGKRIVVVDDSIVRGTTSRKINMLLREAGAREIHLRIAAPPTISPCYYGIDTPTENELIASKKSIEEIRDFIFADSLEYLSLEDLRQLTQGASVCHACFSKDYPSGIPKL